jgi:DNA-binding beta-propeller fold protein YncE
MNRNTRRSHRWFLALGFGLASAISIAPAQAQELCGGVDYPFPYTDVSGVGAAFCPGIMEAYVTGVSKGTTPTTFSPNNSVTGVQMTTFLERSLDQGLARTSRRAALNRWWTPQDTKAMQTIAVGGTPLFCAADGEDIWISNGSQVVQVQASTGKVQGTWTGATKSSGILVAGGKVFATGFATPGNLYVIDLTQPPGVVTVAASTLGNGPSSIAFDGTNIWTANFDLDGGSVSIITPQSPYTVTTMQYGVLATPVGILYDGANIWVTVIATSAVPLPVPGELWKLDSSGNTLQAVTVGRFPGNPVFDGTNIWVPNLNDNSITVVQAGTGTVVATINADASNQLNQPNAAAFDGERVLVTNGNGGSVTVFKAADLSFIANVPTGPSTAPDGPCSDGINFWVPLSGTTKLLRF